MCVWVVLREKTPAWTIAQRHRDGTHPEQPAVAPHALQLAPLQLPSLPCTSPPPPMELPSPRATPPFPFTPPWISPPCNPSPRATPQPRTESLTEAARATSELLFRNCSSGSVASPDRLRFAVHSYPDCERWGTFCLLFLFSLNFYELSIFELRRIPSKVNCVSVQYQRRDISCQYLSVFLFGRYLMGKWSRTLLRLVQLFFEKFRHTFTFPVINLCGITIKTFI